MTDLKLVAAATIEASTHIDVANQAMIVRGFVPCWLSTPEGMSSGW